jgi:hypothetical protein
MVAVTYTSEAALLVESFDIVTSEELEQMCIF